MADSGNNAGSGYPVQQVVDGNLTAVDVYGNNSYGTITGRNFVGDGSALTNLPVNGAQIAGDLGGTNASPTVVSTHLASPLPLAQGGTAAATAAAACTSLGAAQTANNLSDMTAATVRTNLGLGTAALLNTPLTSPTQVTPQVENLGVPLNAGEASMSRLYANAAFSPVTQGMIVTYWTAATTQTAGHIITYSGGTAMTNANCTVAEIAVFSVTPSTGQIPSQLAITSNLHTSLYAGTYTAYTSAFTSSWSQVAGTTYAIALLIVCTSGLPSVVGATPAPGNAFTRPYLCGYLAAQGSMPGSSTSIVANTNGNQYLYFVMTT